jgi:hypothetical protein
MVDTKYPIKDTTRLTFVGKKTYYIRIPKDMVLAGKFPYINMQPLVITVESKDRIVITPVK